MQLTNKTVAAAGQLGRRFGFCCRIRKVGSANDSVRRRKAAVRVRGLNSCSVDNETKQQQREHAGKRVVLSD